MADLTKTTEAMLKKTNGKNVSLTTDDLAAAAANLVNMRVWITDLYRLTLEYDDGVFHTLASTKENGSWANFVADVFIDIAFALAAATAIASDGAAAVPAFACLSAFLHDWGIGRDKPDNLNETFAVFQFGHNAMQVALEQQLAYLADAGNNYGNLQNAWKDNIEFNGAKYTIGDLASSHFPDVKKDGDQYNKLQSAALISFRKSLWNLVIMKCCSYYENYHYGITTPKQNGALVEYAQQTFYPANKGVYLRAQFTGGDDDNHYFELIYWNLGIGGYAFPDEASSILFKDDTPGHIINPDGLFNRSYVFEQFSVTKPDFSKGHELGDTPGFDFSGNDDWNFTGGVFPKLTK